METNVRVEEYMQRARAAQAIVAEYTQEQIDAVVYAVAKIGYKTAREMAELSVAETHKGNVESKYMKNAKTPVNAWYYLRDKKSVGVVEEDPINQLVVIAKPAGVIASVLPTTNPTVTPVGNGMQILKGRNAVIFCPHPGAKNCSTKMVNYMREAIAEIGAPKDLIQVVEQPSIEMTQQIMAACDVVVATGGAGMVKSAYSCGKPSFGVGQGNVQMLLDESYTDYDNFATISVNNRNYDFGMPCTCDQMVHVPESHIDEVLAAYKRAGAYLVEDEAAVERLRNIMFINGAINRDMVGQSVQKIAEKANIEIPEGTKVLLVRTNSVAYEDVLCKEIMAPLLRIRTYKNFADTVEIARQNYLMEGAGHACAIFSNNDESILLAGERIPVCRLLVNQPASAGAGSPSNAFYSTNTLGCGFWGGNSVSENLSYKMLMNYTRVAKIIPDAHIPTAEEMFGDDI